MDVKTMIFYLIGGLGIFLFGMNLVGKSLKDLAGNRLRKIIEKSTNTPLKGIGVGFLVTAIIQSSSGTTSLVVALVAASLMTLSQAMYVIVGANMGAAVTSILIGFNITQFALPILGVGGILAFLIHKRKIKLIGETLCGFGMLFFGLELMSNGMQPIVETQMVIHLFTTLSKYQILGFLIGIVVTMCVQSSGATIGILQALYASHGIHLAAALPIMIGACVGTTITALLASISGNKASKQAALFHLFYNLLSALIFMILIVPYTSFIQLIETHILIKMHANLMMSIAIANIIYKAFAALLLAWFSKYIIRFTGLFIRKDRQSDVLKSLQETHIHEPAFALELGEKAIEYMANEVLEIFTNTISFRDKKDMKLYDASMKIEENIDEVDAQIHEYLIKVAQLNLNKTQSCDLAKYLDTIRDLERISDHCVNLLEYFLQRYDNDEKYSNEGKMELMDLFNKVQTMLLNSIEAFNQDDQEKAKIVLKIEENVDDAEENYRKNHLLRMYNGICKATMANNFSDILTNLERIGDHCTNIAEKVISGNEYFDNR